MSTVTKATIPPPHIAFNLKSIWERINNASAKRSSELQYFQPRLVAVSKTKPKELVIEAYEAGQRHFGENYVNELLEKSNDEEINSKCPDIKWHFIGHLQSNKVNKVLAASNLFVVETVDSLKLAKLLDKNIEKQGSVSLNIFIQINTSGEEEKSGCTVTEAPKLVQEIRESCQKLNILGLMTIGKYDNYDSQIGINPDFKALIDCRNAVSEHCQLPADKLELSMGMSGDFEHAIEVGSNSIRIGQAIFGARDYSKMHN